jgi:hypothetical protein
MWNLYDLCWFTASLSLTFATTIQWSVSQSAALNDWTSSTLECCFSKHGQFQCVFPSLDIQVHLWILRCENILLLTVRFLDVAKFTTPTPSSLPSSRKSQSQLWVWKFLFFLCLLWRGNLLTNFLMVFMEFNQHTLLQSRRSCPAHNQFNPLLGHEHAKQWYDTSDLLLLFATSYH